MTATNETFTPEQAAFWLDVDHIEFVTVWLPGYKKYLSESAKAADPILTGYDLALFENVKKFVDAGHSHREIKRLLTMLWQPGIQAQAAAMIEAMEESNRTGRPPLNGFSQRVQIDL